MANKSTLFGATTLRGAWSTLKSLLLAALMLTCSSLVAVRAYEISAYAYKHQSGPKAVATTSAQANASIAVQPAADASLTAAR